MVSNVDIVGNVVWQQVRIFHFGLSLLVALDNRFTNSFQFFTKPSKHCNNTIDCSYAAHIAQTDKNSPEIAHRAEEAHHYQQKIAQSHKLSGTKTINDWSELLQQSNLQDILLPCHRQSPNTAKQPSSSLHEGQMQSKQPSSYYRASEQC